MGQTWILDVLADLRRFAEQNEMPALVEQLATCESTARQEILLRTGDTGLGVAVNDRTYRAGGRSEPLAQAKPALRAVEGSGGPGAGPQS